MIRILKAATDVAAQSQRADVSSTVADVIADIRSHGDAAVRNYSVKFDNWDPDSFLLSPEKIEEIVATVPRQTIDDIQLVQQNVRNFAKHQLTSLRDFEVETEPGVFLGQRSVPVAASGAYIAGGRYPLVASAHMTIVTAKVAGVQRVTACTPPIRGEVPAATVAAMSLAGADQILCWAACRRWRRWPWALRRSGGST
jgi:sulfopropanediol 3-dehydrogenase